MKSVDRVSDAYKFLPMLEKYTGNAMAIVTTATTANTPVTRRKTRLLLAFAKNPFEPVVPFGS